MELRLQAIEDSLTVDMGWLLERMFELNSTIGASADEGQNLVNFNKRR